jgi:predicted DNA-binding protein with PD1-like motif
MIVQKLTHKFKDAEVARAVSDGQLSNWLLLTETMDVAATQDQFASHETFHISATVGETVNMTRREKAMGGGGRLPVREY